MQSPTDGAPLPEWKRDGTMEMINIATQPNMVSPMPSMDSSSPMPSLDSMPSTPRGGAVTKNGAVLVPVDSIEASMDDLTSLSGSKTNAAETHGSSNGSFSHQFQQYLSAIAQNTTIFLETPDVGEGGPAVVQRPSNAASVADFSDCFRLYIASNTMTFPFVFLLGGTVGTVLAVIPMAILMQLAVLLQVRAKRVILHDIYADHTKHVEVKSYMDIVRALWSYRSQRTSFADEWEVHSFIPTAVRIVVAGSQFGSCCTFAILIANTVQALFGVGAHFAIGGACLMLAVLQSVYHGDTVKKTFAIVNNVCLIAGVVVTALIVLGSVGADGSLATTDRDLSTTTMIPISWSNFLLLFPVICGRISPALFAMDVETSLAARVISRTRKRALKRRRLRVKGDQPAASMQDHDLPPDHHATLERTTFILDRFQRFSIRASIISLCVLVGFGQLVYHFLGSSTHAVVALSLPDGPKKTVLLCILLVGLCATGAINVAAIGGVLDSLRLSESLTAWLHRHSVEEPQPTTQSTSSVDLRVPVTPKRLEVCEYVSLRALLFLFVFVVLLAVPFFDLIAALVGSVGFSTFSFLVPALLEVQAAKRRLEADAQYDQIAQHQPPTMMQGFASLSTKYRLAVCSMASVGAIILVTGTVTAILTAIERQH